MDIHIQGARTHNLKDIDVRFGDGLTVVTGVSGSGKTSLVFDTLYHEARRRLLDVISTSSAGGWRHQLAPAQVGAITGLGPAVAVGQNVLNRNPHSILASASGLHPFLRLLYTHYGVRYCPRCGEGLSVYSQDEIVERLLQASQEEPLQVFAPLMRGVTGSHHTLLELLAAELDREALYLDGHPWDGEPLAPGSPHDLDVALGWLEGVSNFAQARDLVGLAAALGAHAVHARGETLAMTLASASVCVGCGTWFEALEPTHFLRSCPYCSGDGCQACNATGNHPMAAGVRWGGMRLPDLLAHTVSEVRSLFARGDLPAKALRLHSEITRRLDALERVGLGYLALDRSSPTLSRGESQRVRLAISLSSPLEDMLHVLDEPTIGQHPADVARFLPAFRDLPGPVVYVEHDRIAAAVADHAIDLGPGAGRQGGQVVFDGPPAGLWEADTHTGRYFSSRQQVAIPQPRPAPEGFLTIHGAHLHNLKNIDVRIPIARLTAVTGVSGSGKSTLLEHVLVPSLKNREPVGCRALEGPSVAPIMVDQSPIGRNPRSNPATYTKLSDIIRELFSALSPLSASHFSFNRPEGACPTCEGMGALEVKMRFLYSVWIPCADCAAQRFNEEVLAARVLFGERLLSIADFYRMPIAEVDALFAEETRLPSRRIKAARRILRALTDVGLGYLPLGQPSPSLSGGEAQRVKLSKYLGRSKLTDRLLVLDEPCTGLHPKDLDGLLEVLDRLVRAGATIVVVEHNTDIIRAADWAIDLGPGAGPGGGRVLYAGPPGGLSQVEGSLTGKALLEERLVQPRHAKDVSAARISGRRSDHITIRNARANNLKGVDVDIPKGKLTVVTGVSGSGKSSLVGNVLEAEARRRYLESLSMYERQGAREGPEAPVDSVSGLGVTLTVRSLQAHLWSALAHFTRRASVGRASELDRFLAILLADIGQRSCARCGSEMLREQVWLCPECGATADIAPPRYFSTYNYASACELCTGVGVLYEPRPEKLIIHPHKPLCGGAMYSPGYWPQSYLCKDTGIIQALGAFYGFDPEKTPWDEISEPARQAFLYGDDVQHQFTYQSKSTGKMVTHTRDWEGFYGGWVRDWDVHGTYTEQVPCPQCAGAGLKVEYLAVTLAGYNVHQLSEMPLDQLNEVLDGLLTAYSLSEERNQTGDPFYSVDIQRVLATARRRLRFLRQVGLGYLHLNRPAGSLSAGEAQRIQLAGLLGSELTALTVLLDEPSRGMHPSELEALRQVLCELRDEGNTLVVVEHDMTLIQAADHILDIGPGAGKEGGQVVAQGAPADIARGDSLTGRWLRIVGNAAPSDREGPQDDQPRSNNGRRQAAGWLVIEGARENNLRIETVEIPLGVLTGVCGVSGSGKSTLLIDTLGRALVRKTHTTSFANEPTQPGAHISIRGAPKRTILVDQSRAGIHSPATFLGLTKPLLTLYAESADAQALGLDEKLLARRCTACKGRGENRIQMGFLPDLFEECETCRGTGHIPEAWQVRLHGLALPEINALTLDEVYEIFGDYEVIARPLGIAHQVGLGYLVWRQSAYTLSGGEAQRLKIAKELYRKTTPQTLFILDEPTVGQHMQDVGRLIQVLHELVDDGHSVVLVEHHTHVLAACDWLLELGPGGGPNGGCLIASGTPESLAVCDTPTAPYLREVLEASR